MTTEYHTEIPYRASATSAAINAPLAELDAAIVALTGLPAVTIRASGDDDLAAFQDAISGGDVRILLPDDLYLLSAELHINEHNVHISGLGPSASFKHVIQRTGDVTTGDAVIRWGGNDGESAWSTWPVKGGSIEGVTIKGEEKCDYALNIRSLNQSAVVKDVFLMGGNVSQLEMDAVIDQAGVTAYLHNTALTLDSVTAYNPDSAVGVRIGHEAPDTTLGGNINGSVTTMTVASASSFPASGEYTIVIGYEQLRVTAGQGTTTWTVTRGINSTSAVAHTAADVVKLLEGGSYSCTFRRLGSGSNSVGAAVEMWNCDDLYFYDYSIGATGASGSGDGIGFEYNWGVSNVHLVGGYCVIGTQPYVVRGTGLDQPATEHLIVPLSVIDQATRPTIETGGLLYYVASDGYHTVRPDPKTFAEITDDFLVGGLTTGTIGLLGWSTMDASNAAGVEFFYNNPGVRGVSASGTGTVNGLYLDNTSLLGMVAPGRGFDDTYIFQIRASGNLSDIQVRVGLAMQNDGTGDPPANGIYFEKLYGDTVWYAVCRASGTQTRTACAGTIAFDVFYHFRIRRYNDTTIGFRQGHAWPLVDTNQSALISTNVPSVNLSPMFQIKTQTGAAKFLDVDLYQHSVIGLVR